MKTRTTWLPFGVLVLWVSMLAVPVGAFTFSGPVVALGVLGLAWLVLSRLLNRLQLGALALERRLPRRVFLGERFEIETRIFNGRNSLAVRDVKLIDHLGPRGRNPVLLPLIPPEGIATVPYPAKVYQRGLVRVRGFELISDWPFGLFRSTVRGEFRSLGSADDCLLVAPKPVIPPYLRKILQRIERESALFSELRPEDPTEFRSLREFRPGDPLKSIHWPATSRAASLIVRESDPPLPRPRCQGILLHQFAPPGAIYRPDRFEKILRIASGLVVRFHRQGLPLILRLQFEKTLVFRIPFSDPYHGALDALAEAIACPMSSLDRVTEDWEIFDPCDQVFVLGDWPREFWQGNLEGKHPAIVCLDAVSGSAPKQVRKVKR